MRGKRNHFLWVLSLIAIVVSGCARTAERKTETYLKNKYGDSFTYIGSDGTWLDQGEYILYEDQANRQFAVRYMDGFMADNYGSALYDSAVQEKFQDNLTEYGCKVFITSEHNFFGENDIFENQDAYLAECSELFVRVLVTNEDCNDKIIDSFVALSDGSIILDITVECVMPAVFEGCKTYRQSNSIFRKDIISTSTFRIEQTNVEME